MSLKTRQIKFLVGGVALAPVLPFLYLQGQWTRWRIGRLPDATGETVGVYGETEPELNMLAIGESTVAGVGAANHAEALAGQLAKFLSQKKGRAVRWHAVGESGITIRGAIDKLIPQVPDATMDYIFIALGGNDIFKLSTPNKWQRDYPELIGKLRAANPNATIMLANVPRVDTSTTIPNPLKFFLWQLSKTHRATTREFVANMPGVYYYESLGPIIPEFFADGIHPSPFGYSLWAENMIEQLFSKLNES